MEIKKARGDMKVVQAVIEHFDELLKNSKVKADDLLIQSHASIRHKSIVIDFNTLERQATIRVFAVDNDEETLIAEIEGVLYTWELWEILKKFYKGGEENGD